MLNSWFCFGGVEIVNNMRAKGYAETASQIENRWSVPETLFPQPVYGNYCDVTWFTNNDDCDTLFDALAEDGSGETEPPLPWEAQHIPVAAPWASDSSYEPARKFLGVYALSVRSLSDSTRQVGITEGIGPGGVLGRSRLAVPTFRFRVMLTAVDEDGLEYGTAWLSQALADQMCSTHGPSCGSSDLLFFTSCPPSLAAFPDSATAWVDAVDFLTRSYHDVKCIEGPVVIEELRGRENSFGRIVEFTLAAGVPNLFGGARGRAVGDVAPGSAEIVYDIPRNAIPTPSAELPGSASVVVATNYSTNPSVETDATGWNAASEGVAGSGAIAGSRQTGGPSASGTASYRVRMTASAAATPAEAYIQAWQTVALPAGVENPRFSTTLWSQAQVSAGAAVIERIDTILDWRLGATDLRRDVIGSGPASGGAASEVAISPPPTADSVIVTARAYLTSWGATAVVDLYADALGVMIP